MPGTRILLIAPEPADRAALRAALESAGHGVSAASGLEEAVAQLGAGPCDLAIFSADLAEAGPGAIMQTLGTASGRWLPAVALAPPERTARLLAMGAEDVVARPVDPAVLLARVEARLRTAGRVSRLEEERRALEQLAITDGLTGLYNHRHFMRRLDEEFRRALRYAQPLAVILVDLDRFKQVNDTHGHPVGDAVLRHASAVLRNGLRTTDLIARYGGEEFGVLLPQTARDGADLVAGRLRQGLEDAPFVQRGGGCIPLTASLGVAHAPWPGVASPADLLAAADEALYRAKHAGRNQVALARTRGREGGVGSPGLGRA